MVCRACFGSSIGPFGALQRCCRKSTVYRQPSPVLALLARRKNLGFGLTTPDSGKGAVAPLVLADFLTIQMPRQRLPQSYAGCRSIRTPSQRCSEKRERRSLQPAQTRHRCYQRQRRLQRSGAPVPAGYSPLPRRLRYLLTHVCGCHQSCYSGQYAGSG